MVSGSTKELFVCKAFLMSLTTYTTVMYVAVHKAQQMDCLGMQPRVQVATLHTANQASGV